MILQHELIEEIRSRFALDWHGRHGICHWARVYANGMRLARTSEANIRVIQLFALFHDSCRLREGSDPEHGPRGAQLARELNGGLFHLDSDELALLEKACRYHTVALCDQDPTVALCFDADRLDLGRVGKEVDPSLLCSSAARNPETIQWATERSITNHLPDNPLARLL